MEFRQFTHEEFERTLEKWKVEAEVAELFPNEVEQRLAWIPLSINAPSLDRTKQMAYGVFQPGADVAIATCELLLSDRGTLVGKWLKMIRVTLSPEIEISMGLEDMAAVNLAIKAYKTAVIGSFAERLTHDADTVKLYGRNEEILRFLMFLLAAINEQSGKLRAHRAGRWLVINEVSE
jgi:hypothetical protein